MAMATAQPGITHGYGGLSPAQTHRTPRLSTRRSVAFADSGRPLSALEEYTCPPLPPVAEIKSAICRQRVCAGVNYILPVDKTKNSVENVFRTNLRVMFKDPYRNDMQHLDGEQLKAIARHHYKPNTAKEEYNWNAQTDYKLSMESSKVMQTFARSAPCTGTNGRRTLGNTEQRSSLYLPLTAEVPEEVQRLRTEADKIIKSVEMVVDERELINGASGKTHKNVTSRAVRIAPAQCDSANISATRTRQRTNVGSKQQQQPGAHAPCPSPKTKKKQKIIRFDNFEELNSIHVPSKRVVPEDVKSRFLTEDKNNEIWLWLHDGKPQTDLDFFLEVCS